MTRKLAQIAIVWKIEPIIDADNIEEIFVLGWRCIAKKGEFKKDDRCVYIEIDAVLPKDNPAFAFMEKKNFRVKTMKLGKFNVISQGLALPVSLFPELPSNLEVEDDVSAMLKIAKYEPEEFSAGRTGGNARRAFPAYVSKSDETRLQASPRLMDELKAANPCYIAVKCDGSSATFVHFDGEYDVCSRNWSLKDEPGNLWWEISRKYNLEEQLRAKGNYSICGEACSPGVQRNRLGLTEPQLFAFDVYDINNGRYLGYEEFINFCKELNVPTIPILDDNFIFDHTIEQMLELSKGFYPNTMNLREGIVVRPKTTTYSQKLRGRLSTKIISPDFLLKNNE